MLKKNHIPTEEPIIFIGIIMPEDNADRITIKTPTDLSEEYHIRIDNNDYKLQIGSKLHFKLKDEKIEIEFNETIKFVTGKISVISVSKKNELLPKSEAVKRCTECHSQNSMLMATLYKFKSREQRESGFFNGIIINESYVIGANRNEYLNILSFIILAGTLFGIAIHLFFRLTSSKKLKHES